MAKATPVVQYIVVRKDLAWPAGALIAQACHAATAVIHQFYDHKDTKDYLSDLDNMHKIVLMVMLTVLYNCNRDINVNLLQFLQYSPSTESCNQLALGAFQILKALF